MSLLVCSGECVLSLFYAVFFKLFSGMQLHAVILGCHCTLYFLLSSYAVFTCMHVCMPSLTTICECIRSNIVEQTLRHGVTSIVYTSIFVFHALGISFN